MIKFARNGLFRFFPYFVGAQSCTQWVCDLAVIFLTLSDWSDKNSIAITSIFLSTFALWALDSPRGFLASNKRGELNLLQ